LPETREDLYLPGWNSQFEKPTMKVLIGGLDPETGKLIDELRREVASLLCKKPTLEWLGLTLKWCETTTPGDGGDLFAVHVVPDPVTPRVMIKASTAFFEHHSMTDMPRVLLGGFELATTIGHQTWIEFPAQTSEQISAIGQFIELIHGG
tara:strand:- start:804 stop:1253 length:450 start_codon:yes stop_codon:yes gene_type:complete